VRTVGSATYLRDRARRRLSRGLLLVLAGAALFATGLVAAQASGSGDVSWPGGMPVFLGMGGALLGVLQLLAAGRDRQASVGEAPVHHQLAARLGNEFVYLRRVTLPRYHAEADGILLGPHGALVLAIRALSGQYAVRGDDWYVVDAGGGERLWSRSPTWEVARPVRAMQRLAQEEGLGQVPVLGAVVLVHARLVSAEQPAAAVVPVERVATYVDYLRPADPVPDVLVGRLASVLEPHAGGAGQDERRDTQDGEGQRKASR
jgi:hypothetical protein